MFFEHNDLFSAAGWDVVPFAMHHRKNVESQWTRYFVEEIELGNKRDSVTERIRKGLKSIYSFEAQNRVRELIQITKPCLAHAHNIYHHLSPSILGTIRREGLPVVVTLHDLKIACPAYKMMTHDGVCERCKNGRLYNVIRHRCIHGSVTLSSLVFAETVVHRILQSYDKYVNMFFVPSRFNISKFVDWGWREDRFRYLPNFVDTASFVPEYQPGESFVYVGRLSPEKGVATLLRAAQNIGAHLLIIGSGPEEPALRRLANQPGAQIEFLGFRQGEQLHGLIKQARALILPSECYENAPMAVLEAYALGKPVLGANIGGIPELIREGETGLTFASGSIESLSEAMTTMMQLSTEAIIAMGQRARDFVTENFSSHSYLERCSRLYDELLARDS